MAGPCAKRWLILSGKWQSPALPSRSAKQMSLPKRNALVCDCCREPRARAGSDAKTNPMQRGAGPARRGPAVICLANEPDYWVWRLFVEQESQKLPVHLHAAVVID